MTAGLVGSTLGKYEVLEEIGQGGMSVVYRATDTQLKRDVAIKVMHAFLAEQPDARERFHREAVAVARLRHPHIIEIFDYSGEDAETSYIVTELVRGEALSELQKRVVLEPPEAALLLGQPIAGALAHAHQHGVIHRDLKPENILVGPDGTLKLTDFGIARMLDSQTLTVTGTLLGSPAYMAPEYVEGYATDERADIFSFGAMLYQLAVGHLPFEASTPHALLKRIAVGDFVPADQANPHIHARFARIINTSMARLPEDRYQKADDIVTEIERALSRIGLDTEKELPQLLAEPEAYGNRLELELSARYVTVGKAELSEGDTGAALADFDRVLGIDPGNSEVRRIVDRLARRAKARQVVRDAGIALIGAAVLTVGLGLAIDGWGQWRAKRAMQAAAAARGEPTITKHPVAVFVHGTGDLYVDGVLHERAATGPKALLLTPGDHTVRVVGDKVETRSFVLPEDGRLEAIELDVQAKPTKARPPRLPIREVEFRPKGMWVTAYVDGSNRPFVKNQMGPFKIPLTYGKHTVRFANPRAIDETMEVSVSKTAPGSHVVRLKPRPAKLYVKGAPEGAVIDVAGKRAIITERTRGEPIFVPLELGPFETEKEHEVVVRIEGRQEIKRRVLFKPGEEETVELRLKPL